MKLSVQLPEVPVGSVFNAERGFFSLVIPLERTNIITNPILRNASTGWTGFNGTFVSGFAGSAGYHGGFGASVQPSSPNVQFGIFYLTSALTAGITYVASVKFRVRQPGPGATYAIAFATTGGVDLNAYRFRATGRWQWVWVFWTETSSTTRRIYIRRDDTKGVAVGSEADIFDVSGLQLESCADGILSLTTYIDGDQIGLLTNQFPPPYRWNGTPHASTSTRLATTAAGGYVVNLDRYFYKALAYAGLGLSAVSNIAAVGAGTDGATFQGTVANSRQFAINGFFDAWSPQELDYRRSQLYQILGPDGVNPRQPRVLIYQACDGYKEAGSFGRIVASYQSGLEQNSNSTPRETAAITFTAYLPTIQGGDGGTSLTEQSSVSDADFILQRAPDGTWSAMGTGMATDDVLGLAEGLDGSIYAVGRFTDAGGVANTDGVARWDPRTSTWNAMGTGVSSGTNLVNAVAVAPNGDVYVGGDFSLMGGVANTLRIARWNGTAWSALSTGLNGQVRALAFGPSGILYIGGTFTNAGGVAAADSIAQWNGTAFGALGTGSVGAVNALGVGLDGSIYAGGVFTSMGGVVGADIVARWDGSAWNVMGGAWSGGGPTAANALAVGQDGMLYAGGSFTTAGGVSAAYAARWNGSGWSALGSGLSADVFGLAVADDGNLYAGGIFTTAGGVTLPDGQAIWNGSAWVALDVDLPGSATTFAVLPNANGVLYIGFDQTGTATAAGVTIAVNGGTARTYPTFTITGPSSSTARIYRISNNTTGKLLYLNLTMNAGETVRIITSNNGTRVLSDFRGDISNVVLPGSAPDFALAKGNNNIAFFTTSTTVAAIAVWPTAYQSPSDLTE